MSKIKSADLDAIVASVPLDKTAARVMGRGVHYERELKSAPTYIRASVDPLPVASPPLIVGTATYKELVGNIFGRWKVMGFAAQQGSPGKNATWVVKCSCGRYEQRKARAIRRAPTTGDCCTECRNLQYIKRAYKELGSKPVSAFASPEGDGANTSAAELHRRSEPQASEHTHD